MVENFGLAKPIQYDPQLRKRGARRALRIRDIGAPQHVVIKNVFQGRFAIYTNRRFPCPVAKRSPILQRWFTGQTRAAKYFFMKLKWIYTTQTIANQLALLVKQWVYPLDLSYLRKPVSKLPRKKEIYWKFFVTKNKATPWSQNSDKQSRPAVQLKLLLSAWFCFRFLSLVTPSCMAHYGHGWTASFRLKLLL